MATDTRNQRLKSKSIKGEIILSNVIVVGAQWGDEGKAKIIDLLSENADLVVRYQGGCNAGHTVVTGGHTYKFHLIPSGILYKGTTCIIGCGTVINPEVLHQEIEGLKEKGIDTSGLYISSSAHITLPYHIDIDELNEIVLGEKKIGTTKRGIGPTYVDKYDRVGIRAEDLLDEATLREKLDVVLPKKNKLLESYGSKTYEKKEILEFCKKYSEILSPYIKDTVEMLRQAVLEKKNILFEGAQGTMLDIDHGTYPYVTSSSPIAGGACIGSGIGPTFIDKVVGVFKAYVTRVGEGPFATELGDIDGEKLQQIGAEVGTTTGRKRRCGWFDAIIAKHSALLNGLTDIALTKLDVFDSFEEIKVCVGYEDRRDGRIYEYYPSNTSFHKYFDPIYETLDGWMEETSEIKTYEGLPVNAQKYIKRLEEIIGVPISIISIGANREQTIILNSPLRREAVVNA